MLPFKVEELEAAVANRDVTVRPHPTLPLNIYNYAPEVAFTKKWNAVTLNCRGLILDHNYNVVARPWKKFFNLGEVELPIQFDTPVEVMDKVDGSLGILYPSGGGYAIATRGSFDSLQARHATEVLYRSYRQDFGNFNYPVRDFTFLFEIVYPENRIVLDYDEMDDLVLLGAVGTETGYYYGPDVAQAMLNWNGPVVEVFNFNTISDALGNMARPNAEGYVIRSHNFMVKLKQPDYLDLHRLITGVNPKRVWEQLRDGKSKTEIVSVFPDEFHSYVESMIDPLQEQFNKRLQSILMTYNTAIRRVNNFTIEDLVPERIDYAREFSKWKDKKYFFLLLDDKPIREVLWSELKPKIGDGDGF
jgi:RNA ligase